MKDKKKKKKKDESQKLATGGAVLINLPANPEDDDENPKPKEGPKVDDVALARAKRKAIRSLKMPRKG